jgi:hypothetical protein
MDEEANEAALEALAFVSPLRGMTAELHEVYLELKAVGFPDPMIAQILANMLSDAILYRDEYGPDNEDEDEDYDDEDDSVDGGDS